MKYLCETIADLLSTKSINCSETPTNMNGFSNLQNGITHGNKGWLDSECKALQNSSFNPEITMADDVVFYRTNPKITFGISTKTIYSAWCFNADGTKKDYFDTTSCKNTDFEHMLDSDQTFKKTNSDNMLIYYADICIDIDGINKGEDPFGYGIRADGKILTGARADEWLEKGFQKGKNDN